MCALYVGNLNPNCTEATLYQKFSPLGKILNIHICRDRDSQCCLGYGYVNFVYEDDAKTAISTLNYALVKGQPIRLMWAKKSIQFNQKANLFVKDIHPDIDEKTLHDIFSQYGNILSLKISKKDNEGNRCFGFVQFENEESADDAIKGLHGKFIRGRVISVSKFMPGKKEDKFKNIYIKNFGLNANDDDLTKLCERFGVISSAKVMTDEDGDSKGFGFVCFEEAGSAKNAVSELNGTYYGGHRLFAGRAKKKSERQAEVIKNLQQKLQQVLP